MLKNVKKYALIFALLALMIFVLSGCGAKITSTMTIDENFAGKREIVVDIKSDDLSKVTGGMTGLENVIKGSIPSQMTYRVEGNKIVFTIEYKNVQEYREKVTAIISAGVTESEKESGDFITPVVNYERNESYFKKGVAFSENFETIDLVDWYREALRSANIISESESNWFEKGTNVLTLEGTEHSTNSKFNVDEQENTCLSACDVTTKLSVDGKIEREIIFYAQQSTVDELAGKGCELEGYFKALAKDGIEFVAAKNEDETNTYTFTIKADDAADLLKKTNAIMQNENNKFSIQSELDKEKLGIAHVSLSETIDGSFYLDYNNKQPLSHFVYIYNNAELVSATMGESSINNWDTVDGGIVYSPTASAEYKFLFDWQIEFEKVNVSVTPDGTEEIEVSFDCSFADALSSDMKKSAIDRIKGFLGEESYEETDKGISFSFSGNLAKVESKINKIVAKATESKEDDQDTKAYFIVARAADFDTSALFSKGYCCDINYNFTPLFGDINIYVDQADGFMSSKYYQDVQTDDEGKYFVAAEGNVSVYTQGIDWIMAIIVLACVILIVAGIIFVLKNIKELKDFINNLKEKKAEKAAAIPQPIEVTTTQAETIEPAEETQPDVQAKQAEPVEPQVEAPADLPRAEQTAAYDEEDIL